MLLLALTMVYFMFGSIKYFKFSKTFIASNCMYLDKMASRNNQDERRNYCCLNMFILDFWLNPAENTVWYINMKWELFNKRFKKSDNYIDLSCTMFVSSCKNNWEFNPEQCILPKWISRSMPAALNCIFYWQKLLKMMNSLAKYVAPKGIHI